MTRRFDFEVQDAWAKAWVAAHLAQLCAAYKFLLPEAIFQQDNPGNNLAQHAGVDRVLVMPVPPHVPVDEKIRDMTYPGDILLEYVSNTKTGAPGWMNKPNPIGYLHCIYIRDLTGVLLGWPLLSQAWQIHGHRWIECHRKIVANNGQYNTLSVAVPTKALIQSGVNVIVYPFPRQLPGGRFVPALPTLEQGRQGDLFGSRK